MKENDKNISHGFTLIEIMIVVVIIAILALIIIPRFSIYARQSREASMVTNMKQIREAIEQFRADAGDYPANLSCLYAPAGSNPPGANNPSGVGTIFYRGPYIRAQGGINGGPIPRDPLVDASITTEASSQPPTSSPTANWYYLSSTGDLHPGIAGSTVESVSYSAL